MVTLPFRLKMLYLFIFSGKSMREFEISRVGNAYRVEND